MPRDGNGVYVPPANSWNPAVEGTDIDAPDWNDTLNDIASAITGSIAADGQTVTTEAIPFQLGILTNTIGERSSGAGVTVDGVLLKDGGITATAVTGSAITATVLFTDTIHEKTAAAGVTVDGVLLKDGNVTATTVNATNVNPTALIGLVAPFAGTTAPALWALCYGQAISRTTYAALFAVIGTTYGVGDGTTTFNLPDLRGRVVAGQDDMGGVSANRLTGSVTGSVDGDILGASGGEEGHSLQAAENATHGHTVTDPGHRHDPNSGLPNFLSSPNPGGTVSYGGGANSLTAMSQTDAATTHITIANQGSGTAHNTVQPTLILNYIIFAGV